MGRIRTVKPQLFQHEGLYEAECKTELPLRLAFIGLLTCCDREGRFQWRPRMLKVNVLPYDDLDFLRVLDSLLAQGFIRKYRVDNEDFGYVPTFLKHQHINNREQPSSLPSPEEGGICQLHEHQRVTEVYSSGASPVDDANATSLQGKGRDRKGKEMEDTTARSPSRAKTQSDYSPEFEAAFQDYPKRAGDNPKARASKAWNARLKNGHTAEQMHEGVKRYAAYIRAADKEGSEFVKQAATFFGKDKAFLEPWTLVSASDLTSGTNDAAFWANQASYFGLDAIPEEYQEAIQRPFRERQQGGMTCN